MMACTQTVPEALPLTTGIFCLLTFQPILKPLNVSGLKLKFRPFSFSMHH